MIDTNYRESLFSIRCPKSVNTQQSLTFLCSRLVNIAVGIIMILGGISQFFPVSMSAVIVGVYVIIFGLGK